MKLLAAGMLASCIMLAGCGSSRTSSQGPSSVDYIALEKKAAAFVPSIGTSGGELVLSSFSDPKSFNPITSTETSTSDFTQYMYEGLVHINGVTLKPEPGQAN